MDFTQCFPFFNREFDLKRKKFLDMVVRKNVYFTMIYSVYFADGIDKFRNLQVFFQKRAFQDESFVVYF